MSEVIGIKTEKNIYDLITAKEQGISGEEIVFDNSPESLEIIRHSCAHLMAQAIKSLYPEAQFFVGPVVDEGFYYDFKVNTKIGEEDLPRIESAMRKIAQNAYPITKITLPRAEVETRFKGDELKVAVMSRIQSDTLSIYSQGDFEDLCRGPHLPQLIPFYDLLNLFQ